VSLKILLADDSMTAQNMGKKILIEAGFKVVAVSNGAMAMKKIASEKPDVLVLDVFMPGYSGLEICEKIKSAPETARTPIILTVGKMEPFRPEEGNKVKADGLIIKPFEASDLVAAIQKLAARVAPKAADIEKTVKIPAPAAEIQDPTYDEWKVTADTEVSTATAAPAEKFSVPQDMTGAAAFDIPPESQAAAAVASAGEAPAASTPGWDAVPPSNSPWGSQAVTEALEASTTAPAWADSASQTPPPAPAWSAHDHLAAWATSEPARETEEKSSDEDSVLPDLHADSILESAPSGFESSASASSLSSLDAAPASGTAEIDMGAVISSAAVSPQTFEKTSNEAAVTRDPALATDPTTMVSEFSTKFGVENAEATPIGVADHMLEAEDNVLETEVAAVPEAAAPVEAAPVEAAPAESVVDETEHAATLAREMHEAFANVKPEPPSPAPEPIAAPAAEEVAAAAPAPASQVGDQELANALHAAISGAPVAPPEPMEPAAATAGADPQMIARAVDRVLDRFKGELLAEILRELKG
jgi:CheY-like chemotaxis protein